MQIEAIDLFCGAGGLTRGLLDAGIVVKAGFDTDPNCKHPYEINNAGATFYQQDVAKVTGAQLNRLWSKGAVRLLAGCAPCQPFSTAAHSTRGDEDSGDPRYPLLAHFARLVKTCKPELVTMENVPAVKHHQPFLEFTQTLATLGYKVWYESVACEKLGVPQSRKRLVLMASRFGSAPKLTRAVSIPVTVGTALSGVPALEAGQKDPQDRIHIARHLDETNMKRMRHSKPGGTWRDWPKELRAPCHQKKTGSTYQSVYARMSADKPSPTMTTQFFNFGTGRFGHPTQDRTITPREAAILQSFPPSYEFVGPEDAVHFSRLGRMIGNAVPPKLGEAIGQAFTLHVAARQRPKA